tara:strand:+ start:1868 stop:2269 length:402 start_codon:yes stop_codon:yes gene_type:complete
MELFKNKYFYIATSIILVYFLVVKPLLEKNNSNKNDFESIEDIQVNENLVTLNGIQAKEIADKIQIEMSGFNWVVNTVFWNSVLDDVQTVDDAKLVIKAFGVRGGQTLLQWIKNEPSLQTASLMSVLLKRFNV